MTIQKIITTCFAFLLLISFACNSEEVIPEEPVEIRPEVNIVNPIDADGILNKAEANAVVVEGISTLEDGYIVTVRLSDGENAVGGTAVVQNGKWITESLAISNFNNGEIIVTAEGTSETGTKSNLAETILYLDQDPPTIHINGPIAENDIIDADEAPAVIIKGTTDAVNGQTVLVTFGDETTNHFTTKIKVYNGQWEAEVNVSSFKSGSLMLMAEVSDVAGNPATVQRSGVILE